MKPLLDFMSDAHSLRATSRGPTLWMVLAAVIIATGCKSFEHSTGMWQTISRPVDSIIVKFGRSVGSPRIIELGESMQRRQWRRFLEDAVGRGKVVCLRPAWRNLTLEERNAQLLNFAEGSGFELLDADLDLEEPRLFVLDSSESRNPVSKEEQTAALALRLTFDRGHRFFECDFIH